MKFNYQARTKDGQVQSGVIEAVSRESALNLLRANNLFVTVLEEASPPFYAKELKIFSKVSQKEIIVFSRQLAIMFKSEIPLIEVLNTLANQIKNQSFREKVLDILKEVEGGSSLSKAFSLYPEVFSPFYINMVRSGEVSGKLSEVFTYLADYLEREYDFNSKVKGALIYPIFLTVTFLAVISAIIFFVAPQLSTFLKESGSSVPTITKIFIDGSNFLRKWGLVLLLIPLAFILFIRFYAKTQEGRRFFDEKLLKVPLLGDFLKNVYLSRISLNLSTLISGGLPIVQSLEVTSTIVGNEVYRKIILETAEGVKRGEAISTLLARYPNEFPPIFIQMMIVGERTGRQGALLKNTVDFYQKEVERSLNNFMRLLEPIIIVVFAVLVGGLIASVLLPIYGTITSF